MKHASLITKLNEAIVRGKRASTVAVKKPSPNNSRGRNSFENLLVSQSNLVDMVLLVIDEYLPFTIVEKQSFRKIVLCGRPKNLSVMTRPTLTKKISILHMQTEHNFQEILSKQESVCATADLWTKARR